MKHLHRISSWSAIWQHSKEAILRIWSRSNLEHRDVLWTSQAILPSVLVKGIISRGDRSTWTCEVRAIEESELWKSC